VFLDVQTDFLFKGGKKNNAEYIYKGKRHFDHVLVRNSTKRDRNGRIEKGGAVWQHFQFPGSPVQVEGLRAIFPKSKT